MQVTHHLLLSHGLALQALRADGCQAVLDDGTLLRWYVDPLLRGS